jgi:hypothetical protein
VGVKANDWEDERSRRTEEREEDERSEGSVGMTMQQKGRGAEGHEWAIEEQEEEIEKVTGDQREGVGNWSAQRRK